MDDGLREAIKLGIKTFLRLRERAIEAGHELAEAWEDLVEEVRSEQAAEGAGEAVASAVAATAPARAAAPRRKQRGSTRGEAGPDRGQKTAAPRRRAAETRPSEPIALDKVRLKQDDRVDENNDATPRSRSRKGSRGKASPES